MTAYGVPYQGSKGQHMRGLYYAITNRTSGRVLYDPFAGGYAVGHYFTLHGWDVRSSEVDPYTVAVVNAAVTGNLGHMPPRWVDRALFAQARDTPGQTGLTPAEVGYVRQAWSFGNSGTSYLYGSHLEARKHALHRLVYDQETGPAYEVLHQVRVPRRAVERVAALPTPTARRKGITRAVRHYGGDPDYGKLKSAERAERIQQVTGPGVTQADYRDIMTTAPAGAVIYCDPPYADTEGYAGAGVFDNNEFWQHAEQAAARGCLVFVSEYAAPPHWTRILTFTRPQRMAADSTTKSAQAAVERLYTLT